MTNEIASATIAAGWYPDPGNAANLRWWNGLQWSEHTRPVFEVPIAASPVYETPTHPAPTHPAPTHPAPPFSPYTQAVNPYAPGNPYTPGNTYATSPYAVSSTPSNGWATWSLLLGILSAAFTLVVVFTGGASIILSTSGVFAIVNGIRALGLVSQGRATARIRPIFGIALGAVGTLIMVGSFFGLFDYARSVDSTSGTNTGVTTRPTAAPPIQSPSTSGNAPTQDTSIDDYSPLPVVEATASSHQCTALVTPSPGQKDPDLSDPAVERESMNFQLQQAAQFLQRINPTAGWPTTIYHDPKSNILFTSACETVGFVPAGMSFAYAISPDKMNLAFVYYDKPRRVAEVYRTIDRSVTSLTL